jgi:hypothetical protein
MKIGKIERKYLKLRKDSLDRRKISNSLLQPTNIRTNLIVYYIPSLNTDMSIDAPPSLKPAKRYCDVTGFEVLILNIVL